MNRPKDLTVAVAPSPIMGHRRLQQFPEPASPLLPPAPKGGAVATSPVSQPENKSIWGPGWGMDLSEEQAAKLAAALGTGGFD